MYTKLVSGLIFPLHEAMKGRRTRSVMRWLEKTQYYKEVEFQRMQLQRLRDILNDAAVNVPYYRALFSEIEFNPSQVTSLHDLQKLPFLTKAIIKHETNSLKSPGKKLIKNSTSGSTGDPLVFYLGTNRVMHDVAAKWRATRWWGVDIGDQEVVIWASPIELGSQDIIRKVRDRLLRSTLVNAKDLSESSLLHMIDVLKDVRPKMLFGYTSAIARLSRYVLKNDIKLPESRLKVIFVTTEKLHEDQRSDITRAFGAPVANGYGGRDSGFIAHECPHGGMHITAEDILIEIVDEYGHLVETGSPGEVVVTHLASNGFPFIRYKTGDIAVLSDKKCSCGRVLPLIEDIHGRSNDFIVAPGGMVIHYTAISHLFRGLPGVNAFKVVQSELKSIDILYVGDSELPAEICNTIVNGMINYVGDDVAIKLQRVDDIPLEKSGKHRHVVSHVQQDNF